MIICKNGGSSSATVAFPRWLFQYDLSDNSLEYARNLTATSNIETPTNEAVFFYNEQLMIERTESNVGAWNVVLFNPNITSFSLSLVNGNNPQILQPQFTMSGPQGASSPRFIGGVDNICPTIDLPTNVTNVIG